MMKYQARYNPAYKYDMIYQMPIHHLKWVTRKAGFDHCSAVMKQLGALADIENLGAD
jgi:hypothetical protein